MSDGFFVVWNGRAPGLYASWDACREQVEDFDGARYKQYDSPELAARGWERGPSDDPASASTRPSTFPKGALAVDAACAGNPGPTEYRGVDLATGEEVFSLGPFHGTNNVGEFLAIVHGLGVQHDKGRRAPVYSDSRVGIDWVRSLRTGLSLPRSAATSTAWLLADRALKWLRSHPEHAQVIKWPTAQWGEIPADFGRKTPRVAVR